VGLAGCGGGGGAGAGTSDADNAKSVAKDFYAALASRDGQTVCDLATDDLRKRIDSVRETLARAAGVSAEPTCAGGVKVIARGKFLADLPANPIAQTVTVDGSQAQVTLKGTDGKTAEVRLVKAGDSWRVNTLGGF
jgi:hypothetical protein